MVSAYLTRACEVVVVHLLWCVQTGVIGEPYVFVLMIRRPPRATLDRSSAASDVYKRQEGNLAFLAKSDDGRGALPFTREIPPL